MNLKKYLVIFYAMHLLGACGNADFNSSSGSQKNKPKTCQSSEQTTSIASNGGLNCASAVVARGAPPSCSIIATRENDTSTRCNIFVASTGGKMSEDPSITGSQALTKEDKGWTSQVECAPGGETIVAKVKNIAISAECSATVAEIPAPACTLKTSTASIELGQPVWVMMRSTGGPATSTTVNFRPITIGKSEQFTPQVAGPFVMTGNITNPRASAKCTATVSVNTPSVPVPGPITVAPSCLMSADRLNSTSEKCNVSIGSTGGPITNPPSLAGVTFTSAGANNWSAIADCAASGVTLSASVTNAAGTRTCEEDVKPIEKPVCKLTTNVTSIDLGQDVSVTLQSTGGPMVTADVNGRPVTAGGSVNLKPPAVGVFTVIGTIQNPSATATCSATVNVKALPPVVHTLTTTVSGSGSISKSPDSPTYPAGSVVTLTATAATGYRFTGWAGDCSGTATTCTVTMNSNKTVSANFNRICSISLVVGGGSYPNNNEGPHSVSKTVRFPADASNISAKLTAVNHDDNFPRIKINNVMIWSSEYSELATTTDINPDKVVTNFRAGDNTFWGQVKNHRFVIAGNNGWSIHGYFDLAYDTGGRCLTSSQMLP